MCGRVEFAVVVVWCGRVGGSRRSWSGGCGGCVVILVFRWLSGGGVGVLWVGDGVECVVVLLLSVWCWW